MGYEAATYINQLVATNPVDGSDKYADGYLHIRNIKTALKNTFPNVSEPLTATQAALNAYAGLTATAEELNKMDGVTATAAEINYLSGVTSVIQTQLDSKRSALTFQSKTDAFNAAAGFRYGCYTTATLGKTVTLPASASANDTIVFHARKSGTNNWTINLNGHKLNGSASSTSFQAGLSVKLVYVDSTTGWAMFRDAG